MQNRSFFKKLPSSFISRCAEYSMRRFVVEGSANIAKIVFKQPQVIAKSFLSKLNLFVEPDNLAGFRSLNASIILL